MAASYPARSISLPTRTTPLVSRFDEQLNRIKSSEFASSSSISSKISVISNLYDCVDEILQLPSSRTVFSCKSAEKVLEGSIQLLDTCTTITDVLVQMKERSQEVQSVLRRRCSKDEIAMEVAKYLKARKMVTKVVSKALKGLKKIENEVGNDISDVIRRLKDCQMVTCNVLESILVALAGSNATKESFVSKMLKSKRQETESFLVAFEASKVAVHSEEIKCGLEKMEISIKSVEEDVEILFRHLSICTKNILVILDLLYIFVNPLHSALISIFY